MSIQSFQQSLGQLTNLALIKVSDDPNDLESSDMFVHRVIQVEFNNSLEASQMGENFVAAGNLLFGRFPRLTNGLSFRKVWAECAKLAGHVSAFSKHYKKGFLKSASSAEMLNIVECLASCAWYVVLFHLLFA
jgi:hypothetical protein